MPALDGMRILDMTQYEAGTSCTQALAWMGADVVKVEPPGTGEPGRGSQRGFESSPYFVNWNSNKRSIVIDLAKPDGRDLLLSMAPNYDVFVENYGPGRVEKLGIDYESMTQVNARIIYARIKGFGTSGPWKDYKCYDAVAQAAAGAFSICGEPEGPPTWPGTTVGDSGTGMTMALAILGAYVQQQRTGEGQLIEVAMQEAMTYFMRTRIAMGAEWGKATAPRMASGGVVTMDIYRCAGGGANDYAYLMAATSKHFDTFCTAMGKPELVVDDRFDTDQKRQENSDVLREIIGTWMAERTKWEVMEALAPAGVPCSAVLDTKELFENEHLRERGFVHTIEHPEHGEIQLLGFAPRMSKSHVDIQRAPLLSEHADEVLEADLGFNEARVRELREAGVIG